MMLCCCFEGVLDIYISTSAFAGIRLTFKGILSSESAYIDGARTAHLHLGTPCSFQRTDLRDELLRALLERVGGC